MDAKFGDCLSIYIYVRNGQFTSRRSEWTGITGCLWRQPRSTLYDSSTVAEFNSNEERRILAQHQLALLSSRGAVFLCTVAHLLIPARNYTVK